MLDRDDILSISVVWDVRGDDGRVCAALFQERKNQALKMHTKLYSSPGNFKKNKAIECVMDSDWFLLLYYYNIIILLLTITLTSRLNG